MQLDIIGAKDKKSGKVEVSDSSFGQRFNETLVHQIVTAYMARARAGTHATKSRAAVRGGGAKPWRQKGTGRARAGTSSSPIWRGGGMTFAKTNRDYSKKVNKKMYRAAMRSIWSELLRRERLHVCKEVAVTEPKTKAMISFLDGLKLQGKVLVVLAEADRNIELSGRNLPNVAVIDADGVSPLNLVAYDQVLVTADALKKIEEKLQ